MKRNQEEELDQAADEIVRRVMHRIDRLITGKAITESEKDASNDVYSRPAEYILDAFAIISLRAQTNKVDRLCLADENGFLAAVEEVFKSDDLKSIRKILAKLHKELLSHIQKDRVKLGMGTMYVENGKLWFEITPYMDDVGKQEPHATKIEGPGAQ